MLKKLFQNPKTTSVGILTILTLLGKFVPGLSALPLEDIALAIASMGFIFAGDAKSTN